MVKKAQYKTFQKNITNPETITIKKKKKKKKNNKTIA
jgi:hypothetical protein